MRYKVFETPHSKNWYYTKKSELKEELQYDCGYDHKKEEVFYSVHGTNPHGTNFGVICSYEEFRIHTGAYSDLRSHVLADFSTNLFSLIEKSVLSAPTSGGRPSEENINSGEGEDVTEEEEVIEIKNSDPKPPLREKQSVAEYTIKNKEDWSKQVNDLQSFDWKAIRTAKLKSIPLFVKIIIYPFVFLMMAIGLLSLYDSVVSMRKLGLFLGPLLLFMGYLIVFGIAAYWEKLNSRSGNDKFLINGKSIINTLRMYWGKDAIMLPRIDAESMQRYLEKVIRVSHLTQEHVYIDKYFKIGYSEAFASLNNTKSSGMKSVFIIETGFQLKQQVCFDDEIDLWFEQNLKVNSKEFLNTKGLIAVVDDTSIVFLFSSVLNKAENVFDVYMSLILMMKKVDLGKWDF